MDAEQRQTGNNNTNLILFSKNQFLNLKNILV